MSGLLGGFDEAFRGLTEADVAAVVERGRPGADAGAPAPVDPTPVDPTPVDPTPVDPTPVDPGPRLDPRAVAVAVRLLGGPEPGLAAAVEPTPPVTRPPGPTGWLVTPQARIAVGGGVAPDVVIGRADAADLIVAADVVSRRHCAVCGHTVRDLGSANGTVIFRGGEVLAVGPEPVVLEPGDALATNRARARLATYVEDVA